MLIDADVSSQLFVSIKLKQTTPTQGTSAAKRSAAYRARKRVTQEGLEELRARGRENSRRYRLKKKLAGQATSTPTKKSTAMTSAQKMAAYRARKRMTQKGIDELRAKGRANSARYRGKQKEKKKNPSDHLKPCDGYDCQPPDELVSDVCKSLMSEAPVDGFDLDSLDLDSFDLGADFQVGMA